LIILLSLAAIPSFAIYGDIPDNLKDLILLWESWKIFYDKAYTPTQEPSKFQTFIDNYQKIADYNAQSTNVKLSLNKFADLTPREFQTFTLSIMSEVIEEEEGTTTDDSDIQLSKSIDWRKKGAVSPVQTQGQSSSCWLFPAVDALESLYFIEKGELIDFSQQQILDCAPDVSICTTQTYIDAFNYTSKYGIETAKDYPDVRGQGTCHYDASKAIKVNKGYTLVKPKDSRALKKALTKQPVSLFIEADDMVFQFYSSGVIDSDSCGANVNHGVLVVGYDTVAGKEAFIVKNSWGADWGEKGYVYISTEGQHNEGKGVCGILTQSIVPTP